MMEIKKLVTTLALLTLAAAPLAGQSVPSHQGGLSAETAYQLGELDHQNLFNGNLTLSLPIGGSYPVGPGLSYSLTLFYNAQAWDYELPVTCQDIFGKFHTYSLPKPVEGLNAGFGWLLHLGRLKNGNVYVSPDGAEHYFHSQLHPGYPATPGNAFYTQDSSYLRLRQLSSGCGGGGGCKVVEFPDGSAREFKSFGTNDWRLTRMRDAFGHFLDISYTATKWNLEDEHGRSHEIHFAATTPPFTKIEKVSLETFDGGTSDWLFSYQSTDIPRQGYSPPCGNSPAQSITVDLLDRVTLPDGSYFEMTYSTTDQLDQLSGGATSLRLPTGGKIAWTYGRYYFNSIEVPLGTEAVTWTSAIGIKSRRTFLAATDTEPHGTWTYEQEEGGHGAADGDEDSTPCYSKTTVHDPAGNETVHYFSTQKAVHQWSYGLPFTMCNPATNAYELEGPWLSQELYQGIVDTGNKVRSTRLDYGGDGLNASGYQDKNLRPIKTRTIYHDDGDRWQESTFSDFDGLGNFRTVTQTGNFWATNPTRTTTTRFNRSNGTLVIDRDTSSTAGSSFVLPAESAIWQLGTFDTSTVSEGGTTWRTDACFDPNGFLEWRRSLAGPSPQTNDTLVVFEQAGSSGRVEREKYYGGDGASLSTSYSDTNICGMTLPTSSPTYETRQTYSSGVLAGKWAVAGGSPGTTADDVDILVLANQEIDTSTGLPFAVYDAAGVKTELFYDGLGRLISERPEADAWSTYSYTLPSGTIGPKLTMARCSHGVVGCDEASALGWAEHEYDGLGRRLREKVSYPASGGTTSETRKFEWNALGWKLSESTWGDEELVTEWSGHDRFGRPAQRQLPGKNPLSLFKYLGARAVMRQERIVTELGGNQTWDHKAELLDHLGRLIEVCEGMNNWWSGSCSGEVTQYSYSPRDQLTKVCSSVGLGCGQERQFNFDGRGFMTGEKHPEIGPGGNGWTYYGYDGAGRIQSKTIAGSTAFDLTYRYDAAGRVVELRQQLSPSSSRPLKEFFYARTNDGTNLRQGKLVRALRHNWVSSTSPLFASPDGTLDFIVTDHFEYRGRGGRVSEKVTTQRFGTGTRAFRSGFSWNELGLPEAVEYPVCLEWPCEDRSPGRSVTFGYTKGLLTSVDGFATLSYQLGGSMLHQISRPNGVTWTQLINLGDRQPRPSNIGTTGVAFGSNWSTGVYDYDGVSNIHQIGSAEYRYDRFHRLVEGQVDAGGIKTQLATYDTFGNLKTLTTNGSTLGLAPNATTNRLGGGTYDAAGNLTAIMLGNISYEYGFEAAGQLEFMRSNNHQATVYFYDAADERLLSWDCPGNSSSCGSGTALEHWTPRGLAGEVLRVFEGKSSDGLNWKEDFVYRGGQTLAAMRPTASGFEERFDIQTDHLGSTRQITNSAGIEVERHTFYPFGEEATANQATDIPLKFTGHERDRNGGGKGMLDYMHARSCSPITGRFLSVDPVVAAGRAMHRPQSWNRYSEVANNPMKYTDPTGELFRLAGCEKGGDPVQCRGQMDLLNNALGEVGAGAIRVTPEGFVFIKRGAESFLTNSGVLGKGLALLIGSESTFSFATNTGAASKDGGGKFIPTSDSKAGNTIALEFDQFYFGREDGGAATTYETAFAHEIGHAVAKVLGKFAEEINGSVATRVLTQGRMEGYAVSFENRYRKQWMTGVRTYYYEVGDLHVNPGTRLFPEEEP